MRIYEEYATSTAKRAAQRGARFGQATGQAKGYLFVFNEDGHRMSGNICVYDALGEILEVDDGLPQAISGVSVSLDQLRIRCRRIGFETLPEVWKIAFANALDCSLDGAIPELAVQRRRYRAVLQFATAESVTHSWSKSSCGD